MLSFTINLSFRESEHREFSHFRGRFNRPATRATAVHLPPDHIRHRRPFKPDHGPRLNEQQATVQRSQRHLARHHLLQLFSVSPHSARILDLLPTQLHGLSILFRFNGQTLADSAHQLVAGHLPSADLHKMAAVPQTSRDCCPCPRHSVDKFIDRLRGLYISLLGLERARSLRS